MSFNRYFGTAAYRRGTTEHGKNILLGNIRSAILRNKSMSLMTSDVDKYYHIIRTEFPDVNLRKENGMIFINESVGK